MIFFNFLSFSNFYEFSNDRIYTYVQVLILVMRQNADIGPVRPEGHPRMFVRPVVGGDPRLVRVLEGKLTRLTQRVPTIRIEHIPTAMQEFVVGVPPIWLHLFRRVARAVLVYRDVVEVAEAEEAKEARVPRDHGDQGGPSGQGGQA